MQNTYYHVVDKLAFQHQLLDVVKEMKFRLEELVEASRCEIAAFEDMMRTKSDKSELLKKHTFNYRFSSALGLIQTLRDTLKGALGPANTLVDDIESSSRHGEFFRLLRNALVHDGYQPTGMWIDGRYYLPVGIERKGPKDQTVRIPRKSEDVESLWLEFSSDYCRELASRLRSLAPEEKLNENRYDYEWFEAAWDHPAAKRFSTATTRKSRDEWPERSADAVPALDNAAAILLDIHTWCESRLLELKALPVYPFS